MSATSGIDPNAFREFERTTHNNIAESYHRFFASLTALAIDPLLTACGVGAGSRVLEVAAGTGVLAAAAVAQGADEVLATDISPRMIELGRQLHPSVQFLEADIEKLPVADRAFNCVICNFGLGHFPDPDRAMEECVRVLTPRGRLAFSWWDMPQRQRFQGLFVDALAEVGAEPPADLPAGPPIFHYSEDQNFRQLLKRAGLKQVSITTHQGSHRIESPDALWEAGLGSLARTGAIILAQDTDVQNAIRSALDRLVQPYTRNGHLEIPVSYKVGSGSKG